MKATQYIENRLKEREMSVAQMALLMGISIQSAYNYIKEPQKMQLKTARRMSQALNIDNIDFIQIIVNNE